MAVINQGKFPYISDTKVLIVLLAAMGILLTVTAIPGIFIIDEDNYLVTIVALKQGRLTVPGTENLSPSRELAYFDPEAHHRIISSTPVTSLVPPLYAFIALPFSWLGVRGLIFLNTLAFVTTAFLIFSYTRKFSEGRLTPWIACTVFLLGSYSIEYAQGLWPQMLSVALCTATLFLVHDPPKEGFPIRSLLSGLIVGIATGVRQQNIFFAGCIVLILLFKTQRRFANVAAYAVGLIGPLAAISFIHLTVLGLFHPFPKFYAYAHMIGIEQPNNLIIQSLKVFWTKVVDFSFFDTMTDPAQISFMHRAPASGAILIYGIVKKAWIQSSPWVGLSLTGLAVPWFTSRKNRSLMQQELAFLSLVVFPTLIMFSFAFGRVTDGLSFNQRYFLELMPVMAITLALMVDSHELKLSDLIVGFLFGGLLAEGVLRSSSAYLSFLGQLKLPVIMTASLILTWVLSPRSRILALILSASVGWALLIHLETDVAASRTRRGHNLQRLEILQKTIPDHSALFTYWGTKDAAGPLQLERDVVILDVWADGGKDAPHLAGELLAQNRRVFVQLIDFPEAILKKITASRPTRKLSESYMDFIEILPSSTTP